MSRLLDGDAFREIARFVDVTAELDGEMVGEELERNDGEDRADEVRDAREGDDVIGDAVQLLRAFAGDGDDGTFANTLKQGIDYISMAS